MSKDRKPPAKATTKRPKTKTSPSKKSSPSPKEQGVNRITTGIPGFDELVEGGIPKNSFVLLSGGTGTGKSIFGVNFLMEGARHEEPGVYVSLEEGFEENKRQMEQFGWDLNTLEKEKKLIIIQPKIYNFEKLVETIQIAVDSISAKRVLIDSISILELYFEDQFETRRSILSLAKTLKQLDVTTIAISEVDETKGGLSREGVEEFVSDGVISLLLDKKENLMNRGIAIRKMRATNHSLKVHPVRIEKKKGFVVYPFEETFNEF